MNKILQYLAVLLLVTGCSKPLDKTSFNENPESWKTVKVPKKREIGCFLFDGKYQKFQYHANHSKTSWEVYLDEGEIRAQLREYTSERKLPPFDSELNVGGVPAMPTNTLKVKGGWICTYNTGEWGGSIGWYNEDGTNGQELSHHQVKELFIDNDRIFAIEGLAHGRTSEGSFIEILQEERKWAAKTLYKLPSAPYAGVKVPSGEYIVITSNELIKVSPDTGISILISDLDWVGMLYPNSMEIDDNGIIYIGMRQYVLRYDPNSKNPKYELLIPNRSWINNKLEI